MPDFGRVRGCGSAVRWMDILLQKPRWSAALASTMGARCRLLSSSMKHSAAFWDVGCVFFGLKKTTKTHSCERVGSGDKLPRCVF